MSDDWVEIYVQTHTREEIELFVAEAKWMATRSSLPSEDDWQSMRVGPHDLWHWFNVLGLEWRAAASRALAGQVQGRQEQMA